MEQHVCCLGYVSFVLVMCSLSGLVLYCLNLLASLYVKDMVTLSYETRGCDRLQSDPVHEIKFGKGTGG